MKITQKQLNAYKRSRRMGLDGIGHNDAWNVANFGITKDINNCIHRAVADEYGICVPARINLIAVNKRLASTQF